MQDAAAKELVLQEPTESVTERRCYGARCVGTRVHRRAAARAVRRGGLQRWRQWRLLTEVRHRMHDHRGRRVERHRHEGAAAVDELRDGAQREQECLKVDLVLETRDACQIERQ